MKRSYQYLRVMLGLRAGRPPLTSAAKSSDVAEKGWTIQPTPTLESQGLQIRNEVCRV
jgi:hypothetical protein